MQHISPATKTIENNANFVANHLTYLPNSNVPSFRQVLASRRTNQYPHQDHGQVARTRSIGETYIQQKINQLKNVIVKADETLDAMFTLLVPGMLLSQDKRESTSRQFLQSIMSRMMEVFIILIGCSCSIIVENPPNYIICRSSGEEMEKHKARWFRIK